MKGPRNYGVSPFWTLLVLLTSSSFINARPQMSDSGPLIGDLTPNFEDDVEDDEEIGANPVNNVDPSRDPTGTGEGIDFDRDQGGGEVIAPGPDAPGDDIYAPGEDDMVEEPPPKITFDNILKIPFPFLTNSRIHKEGPFSPSLMDVEAKPRQIVQLPYESWADYQMSMAKEKPNEESE